MDSLENIIVDFRITSRCKFNCGLCFRNPDIRDLPFNDLCNIIDNLLIIGISKIGFTGGEPSLRSDYISLIKYAKQKNMLTYLSTIGRTLLKDIDELNACLDWIGLPLDAVNSDINTLVRSSFVSDQHIVISEIFEYLKTHPTKFRIKLSTVVTKANITHLNELGEFLAQYSDKIAAWRLYQFCPLGLGKERRELLEIETDLFLKNIDELKLNWPQLALSGATFDERNKANLIIEPNGDLIIPDFEEYKRLGNIISNKTNDLKEAILRDPLIIAQCENNRKWIYD